MTNGHTSTKHMALAWLVCRALAQNKTAKNGLCKHWQRFQCGKEGNEYDRSCECETHKKRLGIPPNKHQQQAVTSTQRMIWERGFVVKPLEKITGCECEDTRRIQEDWVSRGTRDEGGYTKDWVGTVAIKYTAIGHGAVQLCFDHEAGEDGAVPAKWKCLARLIDVKFFCLAEDVRAGRLTTHNSHRQLGSSAGLGQSRGALHVGQTPKFRYVEEDSSCARQN